MYRVVTMLKHEDFQAHINAGNSMLALGRSKEAFAEYDRVVNHGESLPDADHIQVSLGPRGLNSIRREPARRRPHTGQLGTEGK